jgi:hypothetical protein
MMLFIEQLLRLGWVPEVCVSAEKQRPRAIVRQAPASSQHLQEVRKGRTTAKGQERGFLASSHAGQCCLAHRQACPPPRVNGRLGAYRVLHGYCS